ncbi:MAG: DNA polymerase III subunit gamma/tau [Patescibacteria group bacterium]
MSISRRYRPQNFSEITGQESIKETLRKEIASDKIGHAYIFSGPRGIGKTTTARIFSKALNCLNLKDGEPCNSCDACKVINEGRALDIIEMDAASNTGVDNVRESIVEHVRFAPSHFKFKVYILDEAHMLSTSAWNALLKTLEEPPAYAVFILATTELHKVPVTIVSRCQRFDFKRIPEEKLAARINDLAKKEGAVLDDEVVRSIVKHAEGCARDAETLLDQLLVLGEKKITQEVASLIIPISRLPIAAKLLEVCADKSLSKSLAEVGKLEDQGVPLLTVFNDLIQAVRHLLIASDDMKYSEKLAQGDEGEKGLAALVGRYSPAELGDMALLFMERRRDVKQGIDPRFALELAVTAVTLNLLPNSDKNITGSISNSQLPTSNQIQNPESGNPEPEIQSSNIDSVSQTSDVEPSLSLDQVHGKWPIMIREIADRHPSLLMVLKPSSPDRVDGEKVIIRFQYPFHKDKIINDVKNKQLLEESLRRLLEVPNLYIEGSVGQDEERKEVRSKDMVSNILNTFGGQVVDEGSNL